MAHLETRVSAVIFKVVGSRLVSSLLQGISEASGGNLPALDRFAARHFINFASAISEQVGQNLTRALK